ncbi:hypothetical protein KJ951_02235 [Patescibacteria group bacterium]|nr:hypothetical protein [Patescibacteria group bacterium]MBU1703199.1 hypothetical protein [Patescibacteria group bacterium]MBU1953517.1 hypothetical protein [Patescibacteria group bacterium]
MKPSSQKFGAIQKITRFLAGFLVSLFVVAILLKLLNDFKWALSLGSAINGAAIYYIFSNRKKDGGLRIVGIGAITGTLFMIVAAAALWIFVQAAFQGIAD